jgi:hypothetical protein
VKIDEKNRLKTDPPQQAKSNYSDQRELRKGRAASLNPVLLVETVQCGAK